MTEYIENPPTVYAEKFDGTSDSAVRIIDILSKCDGGRPLVKVVQRVGLDGYRNPVLEYLTGDGCAGQVRVDSYVVVTVHPDGVVQIPTTYPEDEFNKHYSQKE